MPLEKKARVPVRRHVSSSFARIFDENFLFFFAFSSQNFDKEDKKTRTQEKEEKVDFCLTRMMMMMMIDDDDDDDDSLSSDAEEDEKSSLDFFSLENPETEREFFSAIRKYGVGKWKKMSNDSRYSWHRLSRDVREREKEQQQRKGGREKLPSLVSSRKSGGGGNTNGGKKIVTTSEKMKTVKAKLKNHWEKLSREKDSKKIKNEIVKKNEQFRAPRFRHSYDSNKKENEMREKEYQLKPFTNALSQALDRYILECLNLEYDAHEDALEERDGKTIDQVANYCIEKFREEEEDGLIGKYRFGGLFEVCKGAREQRVPQRLTELGKEGKVRRDRVTVPGDTSGRLHMKYVALVDVNGKAIKNITNRNREDTEEDEYVDEDESESEEESSEDEEEKEEEEEGEEEDVVSQEDGENTKQEGGTNSNENGIDSGSTKKRRRKRRAKNGQSKQMSKATQRKKIEEELEKLPPVFYYDGRYLTAEQAASEAREAFEQAELAANEAELAEREAADAEAEARQAAALVESLCAEAETMKNYTNDEKDANTLPNPVAEEKEPERFVQA